MVLRKLDSLLLGSELVDAISHHVQSTGNSSLLEENLTGGK
jgi:hypothetical protein